ncbi:MAG: hypothetical protein ABI645_00485 [Pseudomonadota bacterium]
MTKFPSSAMPESAAEYAARAQQHRPTDPAALAREMRRLEATGLTPRDISAALRIHLVAVMNVLATSASVTNHHEGHVS